MVPSAEHRCSSWARFTDKEAETEAEKLPGATWLGRREAGLVLGRWCPLHTLALEVSHTHTAKQGNAEASEKDQKRPNDSPETGSAASGRGRGLPESPACAGLYGLDQLLAADVSVPAS